MSYLVSLGILSLLVCASAAAGACPRGWNHSADSCYLLKVEPIFWTDAKVICEAVDGHLVEINDAGENDFLTSLLQERNVQKAWTGLEDFSVEGEFRWTTSQEIPEFSNWDRGQPDDDDTGEDCGELMITGKWNDGPCLGNTHSFLCETRADEGAIIG